MITILKSTLYFLLLFSHFGLDLQMKQGDYERSEIKKKKTKKNYSQYTEVKKINIKIKQRTLML